MTQAAPSPEPSDPVAAIREALDAAGFQDVVSAHGVCAELAAAVRLARGGNCCQVDYGVHAAVGHVDCHESLEDGAHVFEVDFDEPVGATEARFSIFARGGRAAGVD